MRRAVGLGLVSVYGPFVVMAVYATLFVSCSHCKVAAWKLSPLGPGLIPVELLRRWLNLEHYPHVLSLVLGVFVSLLMVANVALAARRSRRWCVAALAVAVVTCSVFAYGTLSLIRA